MDDMLTRVLTRPDARIDRLIGAELDISDNPGWSLRSACLAKSATEATIDAFNLVENVDYVYFDKHERNTAC